ncbi:MAG TPA: penicillin-binding transpeptidase domain-containing protein, partial [Actinomycetota bacterium]|nr:penicillin-binding transpeptidase domain-containing protein [Actinomycetota bacterium]
SSATAVTVDRQILDSVWKKNAILHRLSDVLKVSEWHLRQNLKDVRVSPYKPVPVAYDVKPEQRDYILENQEDFFGAVDIDRIPQRTYPLGRTAAHLLGYVGEISAEQLKQDQFKHAHPPYAAGDIVGRDGLENYYDRYLRGTPQLQKVLVNSSGEVLREQTIRNEQPGDDLVLYLDAGIQKLTEESLKAGIFASRSAYPTPAGAAVVLDAKTGGVLGMASFPDYNPRQLADGLSTKEYKELGAKTKNNPDDDAFLNRAIQAQRAPGSTFKIVTSGAAMSTGIASPYAQLDCPGVKYYPPPGAPGVEPGSSQPFNNWTSLNLGFMDFTKALEVSCDTFFYELGWRLEDTYGWQLGDQSEQFQKYARLAGLGHETGIDLPNEMDGLVPDHKWCEEVWEATKNDKIPTCGTHADWIWLPGYTVNMAIGQGDLLTTPLQMAVTTAAVANGGSVWRPHLAMELARPDKNDVEQSVKDFAPDAVAHLPLDPLQLSVIQQGMVNAVAEPDGTAHSAFLGFPLENFPVAGKTGTAELTSSSSNLQDAWFVSFAPANDPQYVVVVYLEKSGHGGETAAPVARQIYEGLFGIDRDAVVHLGVDRSR